MGKRDTPRYSLQDRSTTSISGSNPPIIVLNVLQSSLDQDPALLGSRLQHVTIVHFISSPNLVQTGIRLEVVLCEGERADLRRSFYEMI